MRWPFHQIFSFSISLLNLIYKRKTYREFCLFLKSEKLAQGSLKVKEIKKVKIGAVIGVIVVCTAIFAYLTFWQARAEFEVSSLRVYPSETFVGENVTVFVDVKNIGNAEGTYRCTLTINGIDVETKEITLLPGEVKTVTFTVVKNTEGNYTIKIDKLTTTLTVLRPAEFRISNLTISRREIPPGCPVGVWVLIKNIGGVEGTCTLALKINDKIKETKEVTLGAGESTICLFEEFRLEEVGIYNVSVNGLTDTINVTSQLQLQSVELYWEYEMNSIAADVKYKGKVLSVTGVIMDIGRDIYGHAYILLFGNPPFGVQCFFPKHNESMIAQLTIGEEVTVLGVCDGYIVNVILTGCEILG